MLKLSEESHRILRAFYRGVGAVTVSLGISACPLNICDQPVMYGPGPGYHDENAIIRVQVRAKETGERINGIVILIEELDLRFSTHSNGTVNGIFEFWIAEHNKRDYYTLTFTDVDRGANGGDFKQYTRVITWEEAKTLTNNPLVIELELKEQSDEK